MNKKPEVATKKPEAKKSTPKKPELAEVTAKREAAKREVVAKKFEAAKVDVAAKREAAKSQVAATKLEAKKLGVATKPEAATNVGGSSRKSNGQFGSLLANPFPQVAREFAEKTVDQTRGAFDRSNLALEAAVDTLKRSFDASGQGAVALNRKIIEIAQRNLDSSFDLAKSLVNAKNLAEIMELHAAYWRKQFAAFRPQTEEVRTLASKIATVTADPTKAHVTRSMHERRVRRST